MIFKIRAKRIELVELTFNAPDFQQAASMARQAKGMEGAQLCEVICEGSEEKKTVMGYCTCGKILFNDDFHIGLDSCRKLCKVCFDRIEGETLARFSSPSVKMPRKGTCSYE